MVVDTTTRLANTSHPFGAVDHCRLRLLFEENDDDQSVIFSFSGVNHLEPWVTQHSLRRRLEFVVDRSGRVVHILDSVFVGKSDGVVERWMCFSRPVLTRIYWWSIPGSLFHNPKLDVSKVGVRVGVDGWWWRSIGSSSSLYRTLLELKVHGPRHENQK